MDHLDTNALLPPPSSATAPPLVTAASLLVFCCNGGVPRVDLHLWPRGGASFDSLDPTDWVASDTSAVAANASSFRRHKRRLADDERNRGAQGDGNATGRPDTRSESISDEQFLALQRLIPANTDLSRCELFNLTFAGAYFERLYRRRHGELVCLCPRRTSGNACQVLSAVGSVGSALGLVAPRVEGGHDAGPESPLRIMLLVAVVPLCFVVVAVLGSFAIRMCGVDCFGGGGGEDGGCCGGGSARRRKTRGGRSGGEDDGDSSADEVDGPLDPGFVDRCLAKSRAKDAAAAARAGGRRSQTTSVTITVGATAAATPPSASTSSHHQASVHIGGGGASLPTETDVFLPPTVPAPAYDDSYFYPPAPHGHRGAVAQSVGVPPHGVVGAGRGSPPPSYKSETGSATPSVTGVSASTTTPPSDESVTDGLARSCAVVTPSMSEGNHQNTSV